MILALNLFLSCSSSNFEPSKPVPDSDVSLVSLNIHYLVPEKDKTNWELRKHAVSAALNDLGADLILFQEMETFEGGHAPSRNIQLDWVLSTVTGYQAAAVGDASVFPVTQPILYKSELFRPVDQGFFFFSETPDLIYSDPWSGRWPAFTTWVLFKRNSDGREFYVYNLHLDAFSRKNRVRGAELILERLNRRSNPEAALILAGDFNLLKGSSVIKTLDDADLVRAPVNNSTFHFRKGLNLYGAIDHIFYSSGFELNEAGVLQRKWNGEWPSDHYPLYGSFSLGDKGS